ncbi:acyltransferase ChoActase/COT/CPT [Ramicandelaber brevisporus]|nr:acyltransferase ChoActase/COT/CPT [Ramicandelaber brevisporus]
MSSSFVPALTPAQYTGKLYRFQKQLPKLPVPTLQETMSKYLQTVKPHLNAAEYAATEAAVTDFIKPGGVGEELQARLQAKAANPATDNWLEDWWNEIAYDAYRDPVVIYVSYFYAYRDDKLRKGQAERAAAITTAALEFRRQVISGELEPEYAKKQPLCSDSYKYMFHATRFPKKPSDYVVAADPYTNNHIAVIRKNQFFTVDFVQDGKQLSTLELEQQFKRIITAADSSEGAAAANLPIGVLTASNRDKWTDYRQALIAASPQNAALLSKIETAAFVVCLDSSSPVTRDELSRACWHGDGRNRFFDQALQFIVYENGKAGFMGEHSRMDGTPTCRLNDFVNTSIATNKLNNGPAEARAILPAPQRLQFGVDSNVAAAVREAEREFDALIDAHQLKVLAFEGYGKNLIKQFKLSPDAFAQMTIQLAYFKLYGKSCPTYESAQVRKFLHGRTEVCRTCSVDTVAWVRAMEDASVSLADKNALGRKAISSHTKYMADAVEGKGVDRHLLGLRMSLKAGEAKPAIFADPAYAKTSHWNLSTSQLSSEYFEGYGWGEVVPDGYGVAYMIKDNSIHFNVTCLNRPGMNASAMRHYLAESLRDMREAFSATASA